MKRLLLLFYILIASAFALHAATYISNDPTAGPSDWTNDAIWFGGVAPSDVSLAANDSIVISAGDYITLTPANADKELSIGNSTVFDIHGRLDIDSSIVGNPANSITINVYNGAILNLTGSIIEQNNLVINIENGGVVNIGGTLQINNNGVVTVDGNITVADSIITDINSELLFNGTGDITGGLDVGKNSNVAFNGNNNIDGDINVSDNSTILFDGHTVLNGDVFLGSNNDADGVEASLMVEGHLDIYGSFNVGNKTDIEINGYVNFYTTGPIMQGFNEAPAGESNFLIGTGSIYYQNPSEPSASRVDHIDITTYWGGTWPDTPLPIVLSFFMADAGNNEVVLSWRTESEDNNDFFVVMRSDNGGAWSTVAVVDGFGNSSTAIDYSCIDQNGGLSGTCYKLIQVDFDGTETVAAYTCLSAEKAEKISVSVYPNPATSYVTVEAGDIVSAYLLNSAIERVVAAEVGADIATFDLSTVTSGIYLLVVETADAVYSENLLVK